MAASIELVPAAAPPVEAPYPAAIHSVRFLKNTLLRRAPDATADKVGIIGKGVLAKPHQAAAGDGGCKRWIEIEPRGWACENTLVPSHDEPSESQPIGLNVGDDEDAKAVPGVYGIVRANVEAFGTRSDAVARENGRVLTGANSVRASGVANIDGQRFWITNKGELIDEASIIQISPSKFHGVAIEPTVRFPLGWAHAHDKPRTPVVTRAAPSATGEVTGELAPRTRVSIMEESADGRFVRVTDSDWVARNDLRIAALTAPPPNTQADEKWFDVDLDEQILVAYEGEHPVYATLVSTGKWDHPTPTSIARVMSKLQTADMTSEKDEYSVAEVPWTMYYDHNFALHTSYWHDGFGDRRSHGCINLAPHDARVLYQWSSPDVPPGWIAVYGDETTPGSMVRAHSRKAPEPAFRGYARKLHEAAGSIATR